MITVELTVLVATVLINFILLGFVYVRNPHHATHRLFALLTLTISLWSITNYLAVNSNSAESAIWLVRGVMFFAAPMSVVFMFLMHTFPRSTMVFSKRAIFAWASITILTMIVALSPFLFTTVELIPGSAPSPKPGPGMVLFALVGIGTIPLGLFYLVKKNMNSRGLEKTQLRFLALGVFTMFSLIVSFNFISVVVFNTSAFNQFGPAFTLPFTLLATYTIIRHRLLDIRLALARSLSFTFLVGAFLTIYGAILVFAVPRISMVSGLQESVIAAIGALLSVFIARYVQNILRKITDKFLFQRHADYDAALIDLGKKLSGTINIIEVTDMIVDTMSEIIRAQKVIILLQEESGGYFKPRAFKGVSKFATTIPNDNPLLTYLRRKQDSIIKDDLMLEMEKTTSPEHEDKLKNMKNILDWMDIYALMPLFVDKKLTGVVLLGDKLSGEPYLKDDIDFLSALSPQAATALENARLYEESLKFGETLKIEVDRATHELANANKQLQDLDKAKSEFLSIASHQLYTPLTALRGYLSMIIEGDYGDTPPKQKPIMEILEKSTSRLITLIKGLLDISRIESGRLELNLQSLDIVEMADNLTEDLLPNARNKDLKLVFHEPKSKVPHVVGDSERLRQVMLNFIDNAIKYTNEGTVDVQVDHEGDEVVFSVHDSGKGITSEEITRLFNKFTRVGGAARYHTEGTGLGLYVARQITREHHGDVIAESAGLGQGSTFSLRLPIEGSAKSLKVGEKASVIIKAAEVREKSKEK